MLIYVMCNTWWYNYIVGYYIICCRSTAPAIPMLIKEYTVKTSTTFLCAISSILIFITRRLTADILYRRALTCWRFGSDVHLLFRQLLCLPQLHPFARFDFSRPECVEPADTQRQLLQMHATQLKKKSQENIRHIWKCLLAGPHTNTEWGGCW